MVRQRITDKSIFRVDSLVPLMHHDPRDSGLIWLLKEMQNPLSDFCGFKNPILDFLNETHPK